jgi:hypothetical protein
MIPRSIKPNTGIKRMDIVLRNLNKEIQAIEGRTMAGLIGAAAHIRSDMEKTPPLIPVDTGNLRSSWFVTTSKGVPVGGGTKRFKGDKKENAASTHLETLEFEKGRIGKGVIAIIMGFSANYALWVHEMLGANFKRPDAGPKFFEAALKRNVNNILKIIRDHAKIKT